ncbi:Aspartate aminotransferase [Pseudomonas sp. R4-39-08]|uniref:pyridoxal phosphate-dependent aminotransferase n=1 Tax=Pseudomonas sp. R4-39-08 TaxID=1173288 RepID=UPI000F57A827|nr:pyridoxal phosphate-dependent aminotransferase [Pseudomonas sp. R4-39-08]AZF38323.1 Aspartate aminotransferase [Pseudomonas sp. R4-39-08]
MLNKKITDLAEYASKTISKKAKEMGDVCALSFGEPYFGPPESAKSEISKNLTYDAYIETLKRYEDPRGSLELRQEISRWYLDNYGISVCAETEVLVTHGGVEAITLSVLCTTSVNDKVLVSDPSYMLYSRNITVLERAVQSLSRVPSVHEYQDALHSMTGEYTDTHLMIINSPENPSGYVLSEEDWSAVADFAETNGLWVLHDEVYDSMAFERTHLPAITNGKLRPKTILINSFSKKFGLPGLRIGWMVGPTALIDQAAKLHDYMYLGVGILNEQSAIAVLKSNNRQWLLDNCQEIRDRANIALTTLTEALGFNWCRSPLGAMFLFPEISGLYERLPGKYKQHGDSKGEAVANYLLMEKRVATVPGNVYGENSANYIRLVLCTPRDEFDLAMKRLSTC